MPAPGAISYAVASGATPSSSGPGSCASPQNADRGWCLWHRACTKHDFEWNHLLAECNERCHVDSHTEAWEGDPTGCPPGQRVLGPYHCNKNSIAGIIKGLFKEFPGIEDQLHDWCKRVKPSMRPIATL